MCKKHATNKVGNLDYRADGTCIRWRKCDACQHRFQTAEVPFSLLEKLHSGAAAKPNGKPKPKRRKPKLPNDPLGRAAAIHKMMCDELSEIYVDPDLSPKERRDLILKFGKAIDSAMPNVEIFHARQEVRGDEQQTKSNVSGAELTEGPSRARRRLKAKAAKE